MTSQPIHTRWEVRECYVYRSEKERPHFRRKDENVVLQLTFNAQVRVCKVAASAEPASKTLRPNRDRIVREPVVTYENDNTVRISTNLNAFGRFFRPSQHKSKVFRVVVECCLSVGDAHEHGSLGFISPPFSVLGRNAFRARTPRSKKTSQPKAASPVEPESEPSTPVKRPDLTPLKVTPTREADAADAEISGIWQASQSQSRLWQYRAVPPSPASPIPSLPSNSSYQSPSPSPTGSSPPSSPSTPTPPRGTRSFNPTPVASPSSPTNKMALLLPALDIRSASPHASSKQIAQTPPHPPPQTLLFPQFPPELTALLEGKKPLARQLSFNQVGPLTVGPTRDMPTPHMSPEIQQGKLGEPVAAIDRPQFSEKPSVLPSPSLSSARFLFPPIKVGPNTEPTPSKKSDKRAQKKRTRESEQKIVSFTSPILCAENISDEWWATPGGTAGHPEVSLDDSVAPPSPSFLTAALPVDYGQSPLVRPSGDHVLPHMPSAFDLSSTHSVPMPPALLPTFEENSSSTKMKDLKTSGCLLTCSCCLWGLQDMDKAAPHGTIDGHEGSKSFLL